MSGLAIGPLVMSLYCGKMADLINVLRVVMGQVSPKNQLLDGSGDPPLSAGGCYGGYLSGAGCRLAYGLADTTATYCLLLQ